LNETVITSSDWQTLGCCTVRVHRELLVTDTILSEDWQIKILLNAEFRTTGDVELFFLQDEGLDHHTTDPGAFSGNGFYSWDQTLHLKNTLIL
jgi:hypothetical protein